MSATAILACDLNPNDDEIVARRAKGELMKREADDVSPIETVGKPLTVRDFEPLSVLHLDSQTRPSAPAADSGAAWYGGLGAWAVFSGLSAVPP